MYKEKSIICKIDIEGEDFKALKGLKNLFNKFKIIQVENNDSSFFNGVTVYDYFEYTNENKF